ncbi:metallophosphoesterase family protein [Salibacterium aidingense]|uniref:metallophosphoesterase family protein n=1 Tax=Salibacterium aidingense TaxID=384933 RepID=UPI003BD7241A
MKVVVLGDTHINKPEVSFPEKVKEEMQSADHIIHTGDWQIPEVYRELKRFGKVSGVYGNVDGEEITQLVPEKQWLHLEKWSVGVVHGHGEKKTTEKRALGAFPTPPDILIFGHSHIPLLRYSEKTLLFNPGSLLYRRRLPYCSFGILYLERTIEAKHIFL